MIACSWRKPLCGTTGCALLTTLPSHTGNRAGARVAPTAGFDRIQEAVKLQVWDCRQQLKCYPMD